MSCCQCTLKLWLVSVVLCVVALPFPVYYVLTSPSLVRRQRLPTSNLWLDAAGVVASQLAGDRRSAVAANSSQPKSLSAALARVSVDLSRGVSRDLVAYETIEALLALPNGSALLAQPDVRRLLAGRLELPYDDASRLHTIIGGARSSPHDRIYPWLLSPPDCANDTLAIVVVPSLPLSVQRRELIRRSWSGRLSERGLRLVFSLGRTPRSAERDVRGEHELHGDLIVADFDESYYNLSLKILQAMAWVGQRCSKASYMVKADDDVYVYPDNLHRLLHGSLRLRERKIVGNIGRGFEPHRFLTSKWYVPSEVYGGTKYPPFAFGPCYMVAVDLLPDLFESCRHLPYLYLEDVFITGLCASTISGLKHEQVPSFLVNSCSASDAIAVHHSGTPYRAC